MSLVDWLIIALIGAALGVTRAIWIRRAGRTRWCRDTGWEYMRDGTPREWPVLVECAERIGWWASWWTDRCRQHRGTLLAWIVWAVQRVGYWIRPYDMSLDARRWWFQRPGCWRTSRRGRQMQAELTRAINDREGGQR